jgi:hypothetical protein
LPAAIGSLRLHHSAEHVEQEGFSFFIAHAHKLWHIRGDVNLVITACPVECGRVSEVKGEKRGPTSSWQRTVVVRHGGC